MTGTMRTLTVTWAILIVATVASFILCEMGSGLGRWAIIATMLIAAIKASMILYYFMELHDGTIAWKLAFTGWLTFCTALITGLYYFST